ncbi:VanW family protein [Arsenicicoccus sp. oral taxon 190]|uniref:VanW family protein n=1 Tax=Arsenicicoccus sp. oral taxon 190 TaxID=1658671 RepID=UPI000679F240|nr:VanW family protein [Arsenicicoccus sp. oral taxon 190]AKT51370.1 hypothetical protein ADJ73_08630 [Arsenicicoccus sp. oral taxon 190]
MAASPPASRPGRVALVRLILSVAVLLGLYAGLAAVLTRQAPAGTTVGGVSIGGMDQATARRTLQERLAGQVTEPVTVRAGDRVATVDPAAAGLAVDVPGSLTGLTSFSLDPRDVVAHLTGGAHRPVEVDVDRAALDRALEATRSTLETAPSDGALSIAKGTVEAKDAVVGQSLDLDATRDRLVEAWPAERSVAAVTTARQPAVTQQAVDRAVADVARPILAGPVTVTDGTHRGVLAPAQVAAATTFAAKDGALAPALDPDKLGAAVRAAVQGLETPPVNATVRLVDGKPQVVPGKNGTEVPDEALTSSVLAATTSPQRTATVKAGPVEPGITTEDAGRWGIKEVISRYDADLPYNPPRTTNITIAARTIDGTIIKPGETFSLNGILGERTPAKGYQDALIIQGTRYVRDTGGGVSQVSTSVLNSAFFAGMQLVEHRAHSFYITHYPEGREATVHYPDLDNKWRNDGTTAVLVHSWVEDGVLKFELWGTKRYDEVRSIKGPRRNVVDPRSIDDPSPTCNAQVPVPGFDVTITRQMVKGGQVVKTDSFDTHYDPQDDVTCTGPVKGQVKRT